MSSCTPVLKLRKTVCQEIVKGSYMECNQNQLDSLGPVTCIETNGPDEMNR
jgi:hypothetical protein